MNLLDLTPQSIAFKIIGIALAIILILGGAFLVIRHYETVGYQKRVAEEDVQRNKDLEIAAKQTLNLQNKLDEAQNELSVTKQKLVTLSNNNVVLTSKLRDSITAYNRNLPDYSKQALIERINTLSSVVGECTERYSEMANKADTYAADLKMMQDSWPK